MKPIASFTVDHTHLLPGLYPSRRDMLDGVTVTTLDLRFTAPNREPVMPPAAVHTIEHLGATYLRNAPDGAEVVYFGPMGCRTGFYLLLFGDVTPEQVAPRVLAMCDFILAFEGPIPGATPAQCGNWADQDLSLAKEYVRRYQDALIEHRRFTYQQ